MSDPVQMQTPTNLLEASLTEVSAPLELRNEALQRLFLYWQTKAAGRAMPDRADIDPMEMVEWLPHFVLADILPDRQDVRFRVVGTWMVDHVGRDDTGKTFADIGVGDGRETVRDGYLEAARRGKPLRRTGNFVDRSHTKRHIWAERLLLPLTRGGNAVAQVLGAIYFVDV